jgi:hypothetical protein
MKTWSRKILWNFILAFVIIPLLSYYQYIYNAFIGNYEYYDSDIKSFKEYLNVTLWRWDNLLISIISLIFVLIPFQLIKDYRYSINKKLSFISKLVLLFSILSILIIVFGFFLVNIWISPWWKNLGYFIFMLILSLLFTSFLYFTIDKYVETIPQINSQQSSKFDIVEKPLLIVLLIIIIISAYFIMVMLSK